MSALAIAFQSGLLLTNVDDDSLKGTILTSYYDTRYLAVPSTCHTILTEEVLRSRLRNHGASPSCRPEEVDKLGLSFQTLLGQRGHWPGGFLFWEE